MARQVKCKLCNGYGNREDMHVEARSTGEFNKNGTEKIQRKYWHFECLAKKEKERSEFDNLYQYLLKLHGIETLDSRMIAKIQDTRNGTIKLDNQKIKKKKEGIEYGKLLETYRYLQDKIDYILHNNISLQKAKWNEFAYIFSVVLRSYNDVQSMLNRKTKEEAKQKEIIERNIETLEQTYDSPLINKKKKDDLDISSFL